MCVFLVNLRLQIDRFPIVRINFLVSVFSMLFLRGIFLNICQSPYNSVRSIQGILRKINVMEKSYFPL